jgi:hypothetical protein
MATIWMSAKSYDMPDDYYEELMSQVKDFKAAGMKTTLFLPISNWTGGTRVPNSYLRVKNATKKQIDSILEGYVWTWGMLAGKPSERQLKYTTEDDSGMSANRFLRGEKTESSYY